jgi:hypothetical protein
VLTGVSPAGEVCITASARLHVIVDANGVFLTD